MAQKPRQKSAKSQSPASSSSTRSGRSRRRGGGGRSGWRGWLGRATRLGLILGIWGVVALGGLVAWYAYDLPSIDDLYIIERRSSLTLKSDDGMVLATYGDLYGAHQPLKALPPALPQALIATEDRRFYSHFGVDPLGLLRATFANLRAGHVVQGGSTITQQLAKNVFLDRDRTLKRKVQELLLAFWLEKTFTKDQILEMYLNRVYFGAGAYGVEAAAQRYFDKPAAKLSLNECAMLIGLLKAPSKLAPTGNIKSAQARAAQVLLNMADAGFITDDQAKAAIAQPARLARSRMPLPSARYFADWVVDEVYQLVGRGHGDLVVTTTLDAHAQGEAEDAVGKVMDREGDKFDAEQAALVSLAPDGAVRAMIGGRDYLESPYNRATLARRQPGSAFKPIVYLTAVENGIRPDDEFVDGPISVGNWRPRNYDGQYHGSMSLRAAVAHSINTVAVQVSEKVGRDKVIETARRLGITSDLKPQPALALGAFEVGVLELTSAYAAFANGGYAIQPYGVLEIRDGQGTLLYHRTGDGRVARMIDDDALGQINELLSAVPQFGTGRAARLDRPSAGKTGTTSDYRDAWYIGYTPDLVTGVWVGNDDNTPMKKVTGGGLPAQIWHSFMSTELKGRPVAALPAPPAPGIGQAIDNLWDRIGRLFGGGGPRNEAPVPVPMSAPAPQAAPTSSYAPSPSASEPTMVWQAAPSRPGKR